jgi:hypothetical protein
MPAMSPTMLPQIAELLQHRTYPGILRPILASHPDRMHHIVHTICCPQSASCCYLDQIIRITCSFARVYTRSLVYVIGHTFIHRLRLGFRYVALKQEYMAMAACSWHLYSLEFVVSPSQLVNYSEGIHSEVLDTPAWANSPIENGTAAVWCSRRLTCSL